ncbi:MAG: sulfurtransferase complex subunit TusB [Pseudomonadaceae bacterium]|nr:sulfurtransferase complex subunit TusB [Pseudomonadaceae bacterium]
MATLYQLNAPYKLACCLKLLTATDRLVLIESAVALVVDTHFLKQLPVGLKVFALNDDLQARGLLNACPAAVQAISDTQWVAESLEADRVCSW